MEREANAQRQTAERNGCGNQCLGVLQGDFITKELSQAVFAISAAHDSPFESRQTCSPFASDNAQSSRSPMCASMLSGVRIVGPARKAPNVSGTSRIAFPPSIGQRCNRVAQNLSCFLCRHPLVPFWPESASLPAAQRSASPGRRRPHKSFQNCASAASSLIQLFGSRYTL